MHQKIHDLKCLIVALLNNTTHKMQPLKKNLVKTYRSPLNECFYNVTEVIFVPIKKVQYS